MYMSVLHLVLISYVTGSFWREHLLLSPSGGSYYASHCLGAWRPLLLVFKGLFTALLNNVGQHTEKGGLYLMELSISIISDIG